MEADRPIVFDEEFFRGFPYKPGGFFIDRLLEIDRGERRIVCEMETKGRSFPFVGEQRHHEILFPPHLPGAVIIHLTGVMGMIAAQVLLDLRYDKGWSGYGSRIHKAEFKRLVTLGPPVALESTIAGDIRRAGMVILRFEFRFYQEGALFYFGDQTAVYRHHRIT
jgi:hypothetical protein